MTMAEYAIARAYKQLLMESEQRVLRPEETVWLELMAPTMERYEARETFLKEESA